MRNDSETHKNDWVAPDFEVIAFRDTKGGLNPTTYEGVDYFNDLS